MEGLYNLFKQESKTDGIYYNADIDESIKIGIKDVNDAVIEYGRLGALLTIMQARETSKIKIELRRKQLVKRIRA